MRKYAGANGNVTVVTNDKDFRKEAERLGARVMEVKRLKG
jgi:rRNA-processing protein FCF1